MQIQILHSSTSMCETCTWFLTWKSTPYLVRVSYMLKTMTVEFLFRILLQVS